MLRIYLLGRFRVERDGVAVPKDAWRGRKTKQLLKMLAARPEHQIHREELIDALWPQADELAGRAQLYRTLSQLRHVLEPGLQAYRGSQYLPGNDHLLRLNLGTDIWIDVDAFEHAANRGKSENDAKLLEEAVALYAGDLLESVHLPSVPQALGIL